jgi:hypothetical protein
MVPIPKSSGSSAEVKSDRGWLRPSYRTRRRLRRCRRMQQFAQQLNRHCAWRIPKR